MRLVKGAYWDTEIKRAQERGLADYPVFTRKAMTDLCYMACVKRLLAARTRLFPQFATHNALTVASVIEDAGGVDGFEFQRLYGMGEALYDALLAEFPDAACRIYAPVGGNRDLLAYLVRRLLENGANSSFVSVAADPNVPIAEILRRPQSLIAGAAGTRAIAKFRCRAIFIGRSGAARPASNSAIAPASTRCCAKCATARKLADRTGTGRAARRWRRVARHRADRGVADRRQSKSASYPRATRPSCAPQWRPPRPALRPGRRRRSRSAPRRSNAPPTGSKSIAAG